MGKTHCKCNLIWTLTRILVKGVKETRCVDIGGHEVYEYNMFLCVFIFSFLDIFVFLHGKIKIFKEI